MDPFEELRILSDMDTQRILRSTTAELRFRVENGAAELLVFLDARARAPQQSMGQSLNPCHPMLGVGFFFLKCLPEGVCVQLVPDALDQKRVSDPLNLDLFMVVSQYVGAGN